MKKTYDEPMMEVHHLMGEELLVPATKIPVGGEGTSDANLRMRIANEADAPADSKELW